jgi:hypothetical protein
VAGDLAPGSLRFGIDLEAPADGGQRLDDLESELRLNYERIKGKSRLAWEDAKDAVRAAWHRVERLMPGDFDEDGP